MDLHFTPFDRACEVTRLPGDLAVLMVGIAQRQSASATAVAQARLWAATDRDVFCPRDGAFHGGMAALALGWRINTAATAAKREGAVYRGVSGDLQAGGVVAVSIEQKEPKGSQGLLA